MGTFERVHRDRMVGSLAMFDRMIFKGHLTRLFGNDSVRVFLWKIGVPLTAFGKWAHDATEAICVHGQRLAEEAGRPCLFLEQNSTAATGNSKEDMARRIAERDGITDGLVCVFRSLEPCWSFDLKRNHRSHRLEIVRRRRKCIHLYFYFVDPQFGFMHVTGPR